MTKSFTVTEDHIKLLRRTYISYDDWTEFGAPCVNPKRPYGNSMPINDIAEILEWEPALDEDELGSKYDDVFDEYHDRGMKLHKEMETVLQILVRNPEGIEPGEYRTSSPYDVDYELYQLDAERKIEA